MKKYILMMMLLIGVACVTEVVSRERLATRSLFKVKDENAGHEIDQEIGRGCMLPETESMPFCDVNLRFQDRVDDLIARLTLQEKIGFLGASPDQETCPLTDAGVPRLGISRYTYLVEVNTGVASRCLDGHENKCSTTFASPALLTASFNRTLWYTKGTVIAAEMRAYYHTKSKRGNRSNSPIGLHGYAPNVNLMRDPRWGRNQEVPSEDPFLSGEYAKHYTQGMQQKDKKGYLKMHASIKHYTAYSVENGRQKFNGIIDTYNMHDSYLPAFEKGIKEGGSGGAMCSYASINGVPSCANAWLFEKARNDWNQTNFLISTDCGAVNNMQKPGGNGFATDVLDAITKTLKSGADLEMGDSYYQSNDNLFHAIEDLHMASESDVDAALWRVLYHRFQLGMFDPLAIQSFAQGNHVAIINSTDHQEFNLEATTQGLVLLQNPRNILPIQKGVKVAVVGPHAISRQGLFEGYKGDYVCANGRYDCVPTIAEQIKLSNERGETIVLSDGNMQHTSPSAIKAAQRLARKSDIVIACIGIDFSTEREGLDRTDLRLEQSQRDLIRGLREVSDRVVVILVNGGALAIEDLVSDSHEDTSLSDVAIVEAFYPGHKGAQALAETLFGEHNRWGLLPYTIYRQNFVEELDMRDMSFTKAPGRTYRYYIGKSTIFPFGHGLSYTTFGLGNCHLSSNKGSITTGELPRDDLMLVLTCSLSNQGSISGDGIVLLFHTLRVPSGNVLTHPIPLKKLVDFSRTSLESNESAMVMFKITQDEMSVLDEKGDKIFYERWTHELTVSTHGSSSWTGSYSPSDASFA